MLQQGQTHHEVGEVLVARRVGDLLHVLHQTGDIQKLRHRRLFLRLLVDHDRRPNAAIRVAPAAHLPPVGLRAVHQIGKVGEGPDQRDRKPVARRLGDPHLLLDVARHVRQRIALPVTPLVGDLLVAPGERDGLEGHKRDLFRIVQGKLDHRPHLVVVDRVDQCRHQHDLHPRGMQVVDGPQLDVEQIADLAVAVGVVADAVKLQVGVAQARLIRPPRKARILGELDPVGRALHAVVAHLPGIRDGVKEVRRQRRLAAGKLDRHLPPRLDRDGIVEDLPDILPAQLMHESDLVGVHEARIAHHVAPVGQIHGQH